MEQEYIVAGALPSVRDDGEISYGLLYHKKRQQLPIKGGVGKVPLVIHHQHQLPICTGMAGANLRAVDYYQHTGHMIDFSAIFIYKLNRLYDGLGAHVKGSTLKATMQTLFHKGVCKERLYPTSKDTCNRKFPTAREGGKLLLADAAQFKIPNYIRCDNLTDILLALSHGRPVVFSLIIFTDFYQADRGLVSDTITGKKIGGHSMVALNYDLETELIEVVQSWGKSEKGPTDHGYMYIPFSWFREKIKHQPLLIEAFTIIDEIEGV